MNRLFLFIFAAAVMLTAVPAAYAQEAQEPDVDKIIENQLNTLTRTFNLDEVQVFFVDSILQYNYHAMVDEIGQTRKTGASNPETFQAISDKWMDATDVAFERIFTDEQWSKYMKSIYGKEKKRRDKRMSDRKPDSSEKK
jgi:hypothetical protein